MSLCELQRGYERKQGNFQYPPQIQGLVAKTECARR